MDTRLTTGVSGALAGSIIYNVILYGGIMPAVVVNHDLPIAPALAGRRADLDVLPAEGITQARSLLDNAEILVCNSRGWDDSFLDSLGPGDWIQLTSAGYDPCPLDIYRDRNISFTNGAGNFGPVVAEHTFALALAFSRCIPAFAAKQDAGVWGPRPEMSMEVSDWKDHTLTVYGLGNIGESIAERGLSFQMDVHGIKRNPDDYDGILSPHRVHSDDDMAEIFPETDLLVSIVPLTEETRGSIDAEVFATLPDSAYLINVARGPVVDQSALVAALRSGEIAGAGLDVFEKEPLEKDSPLWNRDDVIITPHVAGRSNTYPERFADLFVNNYDRWKSGDDLVNQLV